MSLQKTAPALLITAIAAFCAMGQEATERPALTEASQSLQHATVTVRVRNRLPDSKIILPVTDAESEDAQPTVSEFTVTVCSGVVVRPRLVVAPVFAASDSEIRITLNGGDQTSARLKVLDGYTGLAILETERELAAPLEIAKELPAVGSWVVSAAAWGPEDAVVSVGVLSATERTLTRTLPPLLQCDIRTAETSSGAGVVDPQGHLLGIILATEIDNQGGWTYAIPASHVQRLLAVRNEEQGEDGVVILKRRRPVVGMVLDATDDGVVVSRVFEDSPAQRAGIQVADRVVAADGTKIRSVYQAVRPMLYKQPGDTMSFLITRGDEIVEAEVVLGGGIELPSAPLANLQQYLRPKLDVKKVGEGLYSTRESRGSAEVFSTSSDDSERREEKADSAAERIKLLTKAVDRYQQAIVYLQERLRREEQQRRETEEEIRGLKQQIEQLRN